MRIAEIIESVAPGGPIIAYHGTTDNISQFRPLTHFGTEQAARDRMDYKKNANGKIYKVQLDIRNPFTIKDFPGIHYDRVYAFELRDKKKLSQEDMAAITTLEDPVQLRAALLAKVKELGYDGFVYKNRYEDKGNISYVILDPSQVKVLEVIPVGEEVTEDNDVDYEEQIENFVQSLNPDDVGVEQIGPYHVHFEGFTDDCQDDANRRCNLPANNPRHLASYDDVYKEVIKDFVRREGGKKPLKVGFTGDEDYPIIYAVFDNPEPYKNPDAWNPTFENFAEGKITLSTDPNWYGADVGDYKASGPVVNISAAKLVGFEPDEKMSQPKSKANVKKIVAGLKKGDKLPPILVRKYKDGYQVVDGHHRFWAYKLLGIKSIPSQVVPDEDIIVKENFADGKKPGRKGLAKRMGVDCSKSETELRKIAKKSSGEKQRMAHWCANMKGGKK